MNSPYPEEFNRQAIGLTASLHFAPTQKAADALLKEGKDPEQIFVTGNTGIDALHYTVRNDFYHLGNRMGKRQQTDCCDSTQKGKSGRAHA